MERAVHKVRRLPDRKAVTGQVKKNKKRFLILLFLIDRSSLLLLLLLSLNAHNHVDDYSGTFQSTFQLWSQVLKIDLLHCHSLSDSQKQKQKQKTSLPEPYV